MKWHVHHLNTAAIGQQEHFEMIKCNTTYGNCQLCFYKIIEGSSFPLQACKFNNGKNLG